MFLQVNHVYSQDAVICSAKVGCAHYELLSVCWPVLPPVGELSSPFNTVGQANMAHLLCFEGSQADFCVPVFLLLNFLETTGFQIMLKAAH